MPLVTDGHYKIFNAQYTSLDADLFVGQPTAKIVGYPTNSASFNMVWKLTNVANQVNQCTFTNVAQSANGAHASVDQVVDGAGLHGGTNATIWTLVPTIQPGQYWIMAPALDSSLGVAPSQLVWSLPSGDSGTQITLASAATNLSQVWTFQAQKVNAAGARGLHNLD